MHLLAIIKPYSTLLYITKLASGHTPGRVPLGERSTHRHGGTLSKWLAVKFRNGIFVDLHMSPRVRITRGNNCQSCQHQKDRIDSWKETVMEKAVFHLLYKKKYSIKRNLIRNLIYAPFSLTPWWDFYRPKKSCFFPFLLTAKRYTTDLFFSQMMPNLRPKVDPW